jgi:hypothetical protein
MTFNQRNLTASIGREKIAKSNHLQANTIFERKKNQRNGDEMSLTSFNGRG